MTDQTVPFSQNQDVAWWPDEDAIASANLTRFMRSHGIESIDELQERSTSDVAWFWDAVLKDLDIRFRTPYSRILDVSEGIPFARWCIDGRMNLVDSAIEKWLADPATANRAAVVWEGEDGATRSLSYAELDREVSRATNGLRALGLQCGDVVALYMPMTIELVVAFLATIKAGGVVLPLFSGYGADAVSTRLIDAGARFMVVSDGATRRGRTVEMKSVADEALDGSPVEHVIVHRRVDIPVRMQPGRDHWWHELIPGQDTEAQTEDTAAEDVLMIIYTSGTTGRPKGAVHTHCGFPVKGAQDMYHAMDVKPGDVVYWMSDMGWMMGPWLVFGTLLIGATMVLYDGAPDFPDVDRTWSLVERHGVTHLGLSPVLIRALMPHGPEPVRRRDLSSLRAVGSTGSPWDPESWRWLFRHVLDEKKPILNYSGGTEISGGILCGNLFKPLKPCAFSGPVPGMDADVVDESGKPIRNEVGELIIRKPWIGMTRGFWKDDNRYLESYWQRFEGVWTHGDFAMIDEDGLWYIMGRSDDTIKVAGKRVGPAEVEGIVGAIPGIAEAAAIGVPDPVKGESLVVFCVLSGLPPDLESLRGQVRERIGDALGKPLKPSRVLFADSLPRTRNAKLMRRLVRAVHLDVDRGNTTALENVDSLNHIRDAR